MPLPAELIATLAAMPDRFEAALAWMPAGRLNWTPGSWEGVPGEMFSALGQACHLRDIEVEGYHVRIGRMLEEIEPDLASLDSYALAEVHGYATADVKAALSAFRAARKVTVERLTSLTDAQLDRSGTFAEYGRLTLRGLLHLLASHDAQHLACLHFLLTKASGAAPLEPLRLYHNTACSKSRSACALVAEAGLEAEVIHYLDSPLTEAALRDLLKKLGLPASQLLRRGEAVFAEHYGGRDLSEAEAFEALLAHPILMERPIAVRGNRAVVARPPERVRELF